LIRNETLGDALTRETEIEEVAKLVTVGDAKVYVWMEVAG
jgi:hypothetical protein